MEKVLSHCINPYGAIATIPSRPDIFHITGLNLIKYDCEWCFRSEPNWVSACKWRVLRFHLWNLSMDHTWIISLRNFVLQSCSSSAISRTETPPWSAVKMTYLSDESRHPCVCFLDRHPVPLVVLPSWSFASKMVHTSICSSSFTKDVFKISGLEMLITICDSSSSCSSSPTSRLCDTHARLLNLSFWMAVSQATFQTRKSLGRVEQCKSRTTKRLADA